MVGDLSTGVDTLDRRFDGGLQPGKLLAVVAPPASQSEALLRKLMGERPTRYVATLRRRDAVRDSLVGDGVRDGDVTVVAANDDGAMETEFLTRMTGTRTQTLQGPADDHLIDRTYEAIQSVEGGTQNVIVDPTNPLEHTGEREAYRETLNRLKAVVMETDSLGVLHCLRPQETPSLRDLSVNIADIVWEIDIASTPNSDEFQLRVPKNRGGNPMLDPVSLRMRQDVYVDDSRNI